MSPDHDPVGVDADYAKRASIYFEEHYEQPKHIFRVVADKLAQLPRREGLRLLDAGGATGEFCYHAMKRVPGLSATCLDATEVLVERGRKAVPECRFVVGDASRMSAFDDASFDVSTLLGVISVFDDFRPCLGELLRVTRPGGVIYVFNDFNIAPIDVVMRWRYSGEQGPYNIGGNMFSMRSIADYLDAQPRVEHHHFEPFELPFDIPYREDDPWRSWTETTPSGKRIVRNCLMELHQRILTIQLKAG